ncbi:MAG: hypothetical protein GX946_08665 [Oligosphaeraceae bacterium]|mgnify:CR=1 FL=1|nr:hypothetical protein [Oligosphaeraceae bacterium]
MNLLDFSHISASLFTTAGPNDFSYFGATSLVLSIIASVLVLMRRDSPWWLVTFLLISPLGPLVYFVSLIVKKIRRDEHRHFHHAAKRFLEGRLRELQAALEQSDTIARRSELGECYLALGRFQEAKECFAHCLRGNFKEDPLLLFRYAIACYELKEFETAKQALKTTFENNYSDHLRERRYLKALLHAELGEDEEALAGFRELNSAADSPELFCRQAIIYQNRQEFEKADAFFLKTMQLATRRPMHPENMRWMRLAQANLGKRKQGSNSA